MFIGGISQVKKAERKARRFGFCVAYPSLDCPRESQNELMSTKGFLCDIVSEEKEGRRRVKGEGRGRGAGGEMAGVNGEKEELSRNRYGGEEEKGMREKMEERKVGRKGVER